MSVYVLIPAYNEQERLGPVIEAAREYLTVVVIDDGSTDDTIKVAEEKGATVLRQPRNQGKGAALKDGFRWALTQPDCDALITIDADGQHDPDEIPRFLECYAKHQGDLIIGYRDFSQMPFKRKFANTVGRVSLSWAMGQKIRDNQSGYRLITRRLMAATLESEEAGFEFEVDMVVLCIRRKYRLDWVPIRTIYAGETSHIKPWHHIKNFFRVVLKTRRLMRQQEQPV